MKVGIVGLPNVGKSTLFNCLSQSKAQSENYPFCTIDPNVSIVNVPDLRLDKLDELISPEKLIPTNVKIVDIAGLVKGASKGEGLGNKFLSNILTYFSRGGCLHFIGNNAGQTFTNLVGKTIIAPAIAGVTGSGAFILNYEANMANYAVGEMLEVQRLNPSATDRELYKVYKTSYNIYAAGSIAGRILVGNGFLRPGAEEAIFPDSQIDVESELAKFRKE